LTPDENKKLLGQRLKLAREKKGWSQIYVSKILDGVTNQALSNYERGERDPDTHLLKQLAQLYDVSVDYLLGRTDDPKPPGHFNKDADPSPEEKITAALVDDPELFDFWQELKEREDLQLLFKQVRPLSQETIRRIVRYIKMVEDEEAMED